MPPGRINEITIQSRGRNGDGLGYEWTEYKVTVSTDSGSEATILNGDDAITGFLEGLKLFAKLVGLPDPPRPRRI